MLKEFLIFLSLLNAHILAIVFQLELHALKSSLHQFSSGTEIYFYVL